jgi:uncharacterized protein
MKHEAESNMNKKHTTVHKEKTANEYIEVRSSGIHRHGVFAKKDIAKGTRITEYVGLKMDKEESKRIQDEALHRYQNDPKNNAATYMFELDENIDIYGDVPNNDAKYINHSCSPNCEVEIMDGRIWIDAIRDIKKGEEIVYNYGFEIDENDTTEFKKHPCKCGATNCVKYILAEEEWPKLRALLNKK